MKFLRACGLVSLALGLAVACESESNPDDRPEPVSGDASSAGNGGGQDAGMTGGEGGQTPESRKGERGSSCDSTTDCQVGLSCIVANDCPLGVACANKSCQPSDFEIMGTGKQCQIVECASTDDCCGDMPQQAPEKCLDRERICSQPSLPGCIVTTCTEDADCGPGTCSGSCFVDAEPCLLPADCATNECPSEGETKLCSVSGIDCTLSLTCSTNSCSTPFCNCANPDYDPLDPICTDEDCEGICGFACQDEVCIVDLGCDVDLDCGLTTPFCDEGTCVECLTSEDCEDEECFAGRCGPECEGDTQCSLFEACQANECTYVGCQSDRECILGASGADPAQDPRLAKCNIENGIGSCVFPCEIDAQCAPTEVCLEGVCEYIGCETDSECKTIAGLHNQPVPTKERPWTTTAECRDQINP